MSVLLESLVMSGNGLMCHSWSILYAVEMFSAVSKAWKTLENEEGYKRCQEIVEEAKSRVDEAVCLCCLVAKIRIVVIN